MARFFRILSIVVAVYALLHPVVHLAALSWHDHAVREQIPAGWTVKAEAPEEDDRYVATMEDGSPLLYQHLYFQSVLGPNIFQAALATAALLGASALLAIAAALLANAERRNPSAGPGPAE